MNIPEITIGSEKQIAWAKKIVDGYIKDFEKLPWKEEIKPVVAAVMVEMFFNSNKAEHFINIRNKYGYSLITIFDAHRPAIMDAVKKAMNA